MASRIEILLEDEDLFAVNKPAGVLTVQGRHGGRPLREMIAKLAGIDQTLLLVHRLDRGTSGVLLFAKTTQAQRHLSLQFQHRTVEKEYLAIVRGTTDEDGGLIEALLAPHSRVTGKMIVKERKGKASRTRWRVEERFGDCATLVRCWPLTGRQHQIRVHLAHIGFPLLVDKLYGRTEAFYLSSMKPGYRPNTRRDERPLIDRLTLHAEVLVFDHPRHGNRIRIQAPLPKDFRATLTQLRKLCSTS